MSHLGRRYSGDVAGGGGGGVTSEDLAQVRSVANAAQATASGKVSKTGDTMTGALEALEFIGQHKMDSFNGLAVTTVNSAYVNGMIGISATGALGIKFPVVTASSLVTFTIRVMNYASATGAAEVTGGGYLADGGSASKLWVNSDNYNVISSASARIRYDGTNFWFMFNSSGNSWNNPAVSVDMTYSYGMMDCAPSNWGMQIFSAAEETVIPQVANVTVNAQQYSSSHTGNRAFVGASERAVGDLNALVTALTARVEALENGG